MILKKLLNLQALSLIKDFKIKHPEIWDIAIYGSFVRKKIIASDLDLAIIFYSPTKLNKKLSISQELKQKLKKVINYNLDIKGIDISDLLDKRFLARQSIIAEGYLLFRKIKFTKLFVFDFFYIFSYSLKGLTQSKKMMFQYALNGRRGEKGLLKLLNAFSLGRGVIKVPVENSEEFKEFLEKNNISYKIYKCLLY